MPKDRAVAFAMVLEGLNYTLLVANTTMVGKVKSRIQAAVASTVGHNMTAEDVKVLLSEGSVIADIACIVPKTVSLIAVHLAAGIASPAAAGRILKARQGSRHSLPAAAAAASALKLARLPCSR